MAAGGLFGVAVGVPVIGFALSPVFKRAKPSWQTVGKITDFNDRTFVAKEITIEKGVGLAGKSTVYIRKSNPKIDPPGGMEYIAVSTRCTHMGCPVSYVQGSERFVCPCHGGVYDLLGQRVGGPPVRPLDRFNTQVVGDMLQVGDRFSLNSHFQRFSPRDPGAPLNGLWEYVYPRRFTTPSIHQ